MGILTRLGVPPRLPQLLPVLRLALRPVPVTVRYGGRRKTAGAIVWITTLDNPVMTNCMPIAATSKPRIRVARLSPTLPNTQRKTLPDRRISRVSKDMPIITPTSPKARVSLFIVLASPLYRIRVAMTPGPTSSGMANGTTIWR
jgi:hypothetical protein